MQVEATQLEQHRAVLVGHCYRMLGSSSDADDAVQETLVRAWRASDGFDGRSSVKTWLYRIATNVCLDAISARRSRVRPIDERPAGKVGDALETRPHGDWIEPINDERAVPNDASPAERLALKQSVRLAFIAALQKLPAKQRAALLLTDVLGFSAAEAAASLELSTASLNSALQRARATLAESQQASPLSAAPLSAEQQQLVDDYVAAFERYDVDALQLLLKRDANLSMPPFAFWLQGADDIRSWMLGPGCGCRGSKVVRVSASGQPAFAQYRPDAAGGYRAWAIVVLEVDGDKVASITSFLDVERLFPHFGLALTA